MQDTLWSPLNKDTVETSQDDPELYLVPGQFDWNKDSSLKWPSSQKY